VLLLDLVGRPVPQGGVESFLIVCTGLDLGGSIPDGLASCGGNSEANATDSTAIDSVATEVVAAVDSAKAMVDSTAVAAVDSAKAAVEAVVK